MKTFEEMTKDEKLALLKLPLDEKIKRTKELILEWYLQYDGQVFVSFSGGKDSTVLLHIARSIKTCADIPAVFVDTGLEYPELRQHVKNTDIQSFQKSNRAIFMIFAIQSPIN